MPDFSREHYKKVAEIILQFPYSDSRLWLYDEFCKFFEEDNPLFDKKKFAEACGMNWKEHLEKALTL